MPDSRLKTRSIVDLAALISSKEVSPVEVVNAHLAQIDQLNGQLNAIVTLAPNLFEQAREAQSMLVSGQTVGPLHGVPITIKDTIATAGIRTTSGSLARKDNVPTRDATAVARLKAAGAIILVVAFVYVYGGFGTMTPPAPPAAPATMPAPAPAPSPPAPAPK